MTLTRDHFVINDKTISLKKLRRKNVWERGQILCHTKVAQYHVVLYVSRAIKMSYGNKHLNDLGQSASYSGKKTPDKIIGTTTCFSFVNTSQG